MFPRGLLWTGIITLAGISGCTPAADPFKGAEPGQLRILSSFPPIHCFAANVAGEQAKVLCLLTTVGPHDYQATPLDSIKVAKADLFLVNGLGLDDFVAKPVADARKKHIVFEVGDSLPHKSLIHLGEADHHVHADGSTCTHGAHDPHVWLGPVHAKIMVDRIAERLSKLRPAQKAAFEANAAAYAKELDALLAYGLEKFKSKQNRKVIVTHDFMRYFAGAYGLEIAGSIQPKAGSEADAGQLAKLVKICKEQQVQVIIVEPQYSKGAAVSIQQHLAGQGIAVRLAEVDPMETASAGADGNPDPALYLQRMRTNIDNIVQALP